MEGGGGVGGWWRLGYVKFSYAKNLESDFFYKESKSNLKKKSGGSEGEGVWIG